MRQWTPRNLEINYPPLSDLGITLEQARLLLEFPSKEPMELEVTEIKEVFPQVYHITVLNNSTKMLQAYEVTEDPDPEAVQALEQIVEDDEAAINELLESLDDESGPEN